MFWKIYRRLPKSIRFVISKVYYEFYAIGWLRSVLRYFHAYLIHKKDKKIIKELKNIIDIAQKNNQPVFVQFPVIPWDLTLFQRPQQFAKAMSEIGYLTIYLIPLDYGSYPLRKISDNLYLSDQHEILRYVKNVTISIYFSYPPNYLDRYLTPKFFEENKVFYEYVDHIDEQICGKYFAQILRGRFDIIKNQTFKLIIGTSRVLFEELINKYPEKQVIYLPNGVDVKHYNINKQSSKEHTLPYIIQDAVDKKRKIIGYFGAIAPWIWDELIVELSEKRPEYLILMIGPDYGDRPPFPRRQNIYLTGKIEYEDLPFYARYFDVSIIPFRLGDIAKATSPLKLFEYFAIGKPVVVTSDLIECTKFDGVASASNAQEFVEKVDAAIMLQCNKELQQKYQKHADDNSWIMRAQQLSKLINS